MQSHGCLAAGKDARLKPEKKGQEAAHTDTAWHVVIWQHTRGWLVMGAAEIADSREHLWAKVTPASALG